MDRTELRLTLINNVFENAVGNERERVNEIAERLFEWVMALDNGEQPPEKVTKSRKGRNEDSV